MSPFQTDTSVILHTVSDEIFSLILYFVQIGSAFKLLCVIIEI